MRSRAHINSRYFALILALSVLMSWYVSCTQAKFSLSSGPSTRPIPTQLEGGNGDGYAGKQRILHHYVDGFKCEGLERPKAILLKNAENKWVLIENQPDKCEAIDSVPALNVVYDDVLKMGSFGGKRFVLPHPLRVDLNEDPNILDRRPGDGVCETPNRRCSLAAAMQEASYISSTGPVVVEIPVGRFLLTAPLTVNIINAHTVTLRGWDKSSTVLDGQSLTDILRLSGQNSGTLKVDGLSFVGGKSMGYLWAKGGSGITRMYPEFVNLDVDNCVFRDNFGHAITSDRGSSDFAIRNSEFINNTEVSIGINGPRRLFVENSSFSGSSSGFNIRNAWNVTIKNSAIWGGDTAIAMYECMNCVIENVSIYNNALGIYLGMDSGGSGGLKLRNSALYMNGESLSLGLLGALDRVEITNSVLATNNATKPNCVGADVATKVFTSSSLIDDTTCGVGTGNIIMNPLFDIFANYGGPTPSLKPLPGSPLIDAGDNATCASLDQRGIARPIDKLGLGARCDIGPVEVE